MPNTFGSAESLRISSVSVFSGDKDAELVFEKETGLLCEVRLENTVVKITDSFVNGTDITE